MIRHTLSEPPLISGCWTILYDSMKIVKNPLDWCGGNLASSWQNHPGAIDLPGTQAEKALFEAFAAQLGQEDRERLDGPLGSSGETSQIAVLASPPRAASVPRSSGPIFISMGRIILRNSHSKTIFVLCGNIKGRVHISLQILETVKKKSLFHKEQRRHLLRFNSLSSLKGNKTNDSLSVI